MNMGGGKKGYKLNPMAKAKSGKMMNAKYGKMAKAKYGKMAKAKTGKLVGKQKDLPAHLQKAILA